MVATTFLPSSTVDPPILQFGNHRQDSVSIFQQVSSVFYKQGTPDEILANNNIAFCSQQVRQFLHL